MSAACPSAAWDRHINDQDEANAAHAQFYKDNREAILKVLCALLTVRNNAMRMSDGALEDMVEEAARIVYAVNDRGELG